MNNEDMSDMIQKISSMINNSNNSDSTSIDNTQDISSNSNETSFENLQNILSNMNFNSNNNDNYDETNYDNINHNNTNNFNFDFETIMKMKTIMDSFTSAQNSPEANLLMSLKPYLNNNRRQKLDQYMQFLNLSKVIEAFNNGGVNNK